MEGCGRKRRQAGRFRPDPPDERAIVALALRQHGAVALWQLRGLGLSASAVRSRAAAGRLWRVHAGVYAVGLPRLGRKGRFMAAVLACGADAVLSHRSAAALWDLGTAVRPAVDVTTRTRAGRSRAGVRAHSGATLAPRDVTAVEAIPCTTLARTLLDLAEGAATREVERAVERCAILRLLDMRQIDDVLARADGRRGAAVLRAVVSEIRVGATLTRSELEERFLALCRDAALPLPEVNAWLPMPPNGFEVDFLWRAARLVAEVDGHAAHGTRAAFERDRRRDQRLVLAGWRVVRFTWRQVAEERDAVTATIGGLLGRGVRPHGEDVAMATPTGAA